ncbi:MAG TPA: serine/threonine protein kinase, partial [Ktedonobacter sp.]|nr:serine/threonine protein kinase [Ktedonobacter sp.]
LDPDNANAYTNKGNALHDLKRYKEALVAYEQALRLDPDNANAYNGKGLIFDQLKRPVEAEQAFAKAKQLGYPP